MYGLCMTRICFAEGDSFDGGSAAAANPPDRYCNEYVIRSVAWNVTRRRRNGKFVDLLFACI